MPKLKNHDNILRRNAAIVRRYDELCGQFKSRSKRVRIIAYEFYMNSRQINHILKISNQDGKQTEDGSREPRNNN